MRDETYYRRQQQRAQINRWLTKFRRDQPVMYYGFLLGLAMCVAGLLLKVLELVQ